ncbi:MAG: matrixin family metalloprotease, partial [Verrucomicrobiota bacterium]|nr:matrixin family metalloprotease [Verrucomicrobiota bacterium]
MICSCRTSVFRIRRAFASAARVAAAAFVAAATLQSANAYVLNGKVWATGSNVVMQLELGPAGKTLTDGNTSWNAAVAPALDARNQQIARMQFGSVMNSTAPLSSGDRINTVAFSSTVFGQAFGSSTLAVTYYIMQGSNMVEADVLFNQAQTFDSYHGPLKFAGSGYAIADIRRVFLHELGHALGLNHSTGDVVMNAITSDREVLAADDIAGAQAMYGVPVTTPTPAPTPAPTDSRLVNISTRMKVGT